MFPSGYPRRGDVYWADLRPPVGSEPAYARPVVVVSRDRGNEAGNTVMVAVVSESDKPYPEHILLPDGLPVSGTVKCGQLMTLNKSVLRDFQCALDGETMLRVDQGLGSALDLSR